MQSPLSREVVGVDLEGCLVLLGRLLLVPQAPVALAEVVVGVGQIRLLGQFDVRFDGKRIVIASRSGQSLLAYLALTAGPPTRR